MTVHKWSTISFAKYVLGQTNNTYRLESAYNRIDEKVRIKHLECGTTFLMTPGRFIAGQRCSNDYCKRKHQQEACWKKSYKKLVNYVSKLDDYQLLTGFSKFNGIDHRVKILHKNCNSYLSITPHSFEMGRRCNRCSRHKSACKRRKKNALSIMQAKLGSDYLIKTKQYYRNTDILEVEHLKCKLTYPVKANRILSGYGQCPECVTKRVTSYKTLIELLSRHNCILISVPKRFYHSKDKIKIKHLKCNYECTTDIRNVKHPRNKWNMICRSCLKECLRKNRLKSTRKFCQDFHKKRLDSINYLIVGEYTGAHRKIRIFHKQCGQYSSVEPNQLLKGVGCSKCANLGKSVGEELISILLDKKHIDYEYPKKFDDLVDQKPLHYDFYIQSKNILIEYQGEQHFKPKTFGGISKKQALANFKLQQKHDQMKRDYAKKHGYKLVTIEWKEFYDDKVNEIERKLISLLD